jgi:hypothetical protein
MVRLPEICFSVFVDRQAAAEAVAVVREEAEGTGGALVAIDADQGAEAWTCRRQT